MVVRFTVHPSLVFVVILAMLCRSARSMHTESLTPAASTAAAATALPLPLLLLRRRLIPGIHTLNALRTNLLVLRTKFNCHDTTVKFCSYYEQICQYYEQFAALKQRRAEPRHGGERHSILQPSTALPTVREEHDTARVSYAVRLPPVPPPTPTPGTSGHAAGEALPTSTTTRDNTRRRALSSGSSGLRNHFHSPPPLPRSNI